MRSAVPQYCLSCQRSQQHLQRCGSTTKQQHLICRFHRYNTQQVLLMPCSCRDVLSHRDDLASSTFAWQHSGLCADNTDLNTAIAIHSVLIMRMQQSAKGAHAVCYQPAAAEGCCRQHKRQIRRRISIATGHTSCSIEQQHRMCRLVYRAPTCTTQNTYKRMHTC
jgi:hypothetical protein